MTDTKPLPLQETATYLFKVKRCTRWDVYPQQEPVEECIVTGRPGYVEKFPGYALADQHPKWKVAAPILVSIERIDVPAKIR
jgi:hypothetical protein